MLDVFAAEACVVDVDYKLCKQANKLMAIRMTSLSEGGVKEERGRRGRREVVGIPSNPTYLKSRVSQAPACPSESTSSDGESVNPNR